MSNVSGGTVTVRVQGQDIGLSDLLNRINQQMAASGQNAKTYASAMAQISPAARSTDQALSSYAQSLARVAAAQGETGASQRILIQALQQLTPNTTAANNALLALQNSLNKEAAAAEADALALQKLNQQKTVLAAQPATTPTKSTDAQTLSLGKLVTAYFAVTRVAKEFAKVISEGNELEKTLTTFRILSGSQEQYAKNLAIAKEQQKLFGGSLNDTVEGMSEFANLSNRTGIEVNKLTNLARAMATVDPAQGFKGAGIALKEFFSGNLTSLARRFEIPREALAGIEKITDQKAKFEELNRVLAQFGISQELVTAQANTTAVTFDKLGGAAADAKAAIGQALASSLSNVAKVMTADLQEIAVGLGTLTTRADQLKGFESRIFTTTSQGGIELFNAKIRQTNAAIDESAGILSIFTGHVQELTPAQFAFVSALVATGSSANEAFDALQKNATVLDSIRSNIASAVAWYGVGAEQAKAFAIALGEEASTSAEAAAFAQGLAQAVANGLPIDAAMIALQQFKANQLRITTEAQAAATQATQAALEATDLFTQKVTENAAEQITSQAAGDALKITQDQLYAAALAAAQGMGATTQSAQILAGQFGITTASAYNLIAALAQLEVAKAKQALGVQPGGANEREDRLGTNEQIIARAKEADLAKKLAEVQRANALAAADAAGKVELENEALGRLNKGTVEYETQLGKVQKAERDLAAEQERKRKKNSGAPKLTPNEKINVGLLDEQDKFNDKFEDAEQKHWDKVADIYAKFNEAQQAQFAKNEVSKRRSRADFYAGLQDAPAGVDTKKFAAQYEEAFAKAQEIAQSGKAKLAAEFLDLRQKQIQEMEKLDEESAKIVQQQKEHKISKKDAQSQLDYLAGRKKLIEDAQAEEQKLLLANGDENQNKLKEQLDAEDQAYADSTEKIGLSAERAAEAKIKHAQRSKIAVDQENLSLAEQQRRYERIAQLNGGQVPASQRGSVLPTSSGGTQGTAKETVDVKASDPIPVTSAEAIIVRQAELFMVHDVDVMASIGDMAARVESKLSEVVSAVNDAKTAISGAVNAVEGAVGRIKINNPSVVGA